MHGCISEAYVLVGEHIAKSARKSKRSTAYLVVRLRR